MLNSGHALIFPSFLLWVHETDRAISVSCCKAFSLLLNSFLGLFLALTLSTFWILKCEPQAWLCYHNPLQSQCFIWRKINLPDPSYYLCCVLIPRQPLPLLSACQRGVHTETLTHNNLQPLFRAVLYEAIPARKEQPTPPPPSKYLWALASGIVIRWALLTQWSPSLVWLPH